MTDAPAADFKASAGLGFAFEVFRARRTAFLTLVLAQAVGGGLAGYLQIALTAEPGLAYMRAAAETQAGGDPSALLAASGPYMTASALGLLVTVVVALWLEAAWMRLFALGRLRVLPNGRDELRLFVVFAALMAIMFGVYVLFGVVVGAAAVIAAASGSVGVGVLVGVAFGVPALALMVWFAAKFAPAAALSLTRSKIALGDAWIGTRGRAGSIALALVLSWLIALSVMFAGFILFSLVPNPITSGVAAAMTGDSVGQYEAYARAVGDGEGRGAMIAVFLLQNALAGVVAALPRGVGAKAALAIDEAGR